MKACPYLLAWEQFLDASLDEPTAQLLVNHLETCSSCQKQVSTFSRPWEIAEEIRGEEWFHALLKGNSPPSPRIKEDHPPASPDSTPTGPDASAFPRIPGIEIIEIIGEGGMGTVYRARDLSLNRIVAVKVWNRGNLLPKEAKARALQEANTLGRLRHPNVVQIYWSGESGNLPYLVMEWIPGGNLETWVKSHSLSPTEVAEIVRDLAGGLAEIHAMGIIHRDLKPANVLIDTTKAGSPSVKLADFGIARIEKDHPAGLTKTGIIVGTPGFIAPEQTGIDPALGPVSPRTDIHGLGAILYFLMTGQAPYEAISSLQSLNHAAEGIYNSVAMSQSGKPRDLCTITEKCLRRIPGERYQSANAVFDDLLRYLQGKPILARPISSAERLWKIMARNTVTTLLSLLLALSLAVLSGVVVSKLGRGIVKTALEKIVFQVTTKDGLLEDIERLMTGGKPLDEKNRALLKQIFDSCCTLPVSQDSEKIQRMDRFNRIGIIFQKLNQFEDAKACYQLIFRESSEALRIPNHDVTIRKKYQNLYLSSGVNLHNALFALMDREGCLSLSRTLEASLESVDLQDPDQAYKYFNIINQRATDYATFVKTADPIPVFLKGIQTGRDLPLEASSSERVWDAYLGLYYNLGLTYFNQKNPDKALATHKEHFNILQKAEKRFPDHWKSYRSREAAALSRMLTTIRNDPDLEQTSKIIQQKQDLLTDALEKDPKDPGFLTESINCAVDKYNVLDQRGNLKEAEKILEHAVRQADLLIAAEPAIFDRTSTKCFILINYAYLLAKTNRGDDAVKQLQLARSLCIPWLPKNGHPHSRFIYFSTIDDEIKIHAEINNLSDACRCLKEKIAMREQLEQPVGLDLDYLLLARYQLLSCNLMATIDATVRAIPESISHLESLTINYLKNLQPIP